MKTMIVINARGIPTNKMIASLFILSTSETTILDYTVFRKVNETDTDHSIYLDPEVKKDENLIVCTVFERFDSCEDIRIVFGLFCLSCFCLYETVTIETRETTMRTRRRTRIENPVSPKFHASDIGYLHY
jgi:hypothetical protein